MEFNLPDPETIRKRHEVAQAIDPVAKKAIKKCGGRKDFEPRTSLYPIDQKASILSYSHLKESLATRLGRDDCKQLADFFAMGGEEWNTISNSDRPAASLFLALEKKGVIQPSSVDRLGEAFRALKMSQSFYLVVNLYQRFRGKNLRRHLNRHSYHDKDF